MNSLDAFPGPEPPDASGRELVLPPPRQGGTWSLRWLAADGALIAADTPLYEAKADSDPAERIAVSIPLPCRLRISRPGGRYLPPGAIGRLEYGPALQAELGRAAQEYRQGTQAIARLQAEITGLEQQLQGGAASPGELARALGARLSARPPGQELSPLELLRLAELYRLLRQIFSGNAPQRAPLAIPLAEDCAQAALERWFAVKIAQAQANAANLPPDISGQAVVLWETLQEVFCEQLAAHGLG